MYHMFLVRIRRQMFYNTCCSYCDRYNRTICHGLGFKSVW